MTEQEIEALCGDIEVLIERQREGRGDKLYRGEADTELPAPSPQYASFNSRGGGWRKETKMPNAIDVSGLRFGRLTALNTYIHGTNKRRRVLCLCDCAQYTYVEPRALRKGDTKSCGCLQKDIVGQNNSKRLVHGTRNNPSYNIWVHMKGRCFNEKNAKYPLYGAKGITVCDEWKDDFGAFDRDMGPRPSANHSIDRIDNSKGYEQGNCRWATNLEQARNKRHHRLVEHDGRMVPLSQACAETGVNYRSALGRINAGKNWQPLPTPPETGQ